MGVGDVGVQGSDINGRQNGVGRDGERLFEIEEKGLCP